MTEEKRYLPLFDENGNWVPHPDLYVLIRISVREDQGDEDVEQAYQYIAKASDNTKAVLNGPQALLERQYISGHTTERRYAAMVLTELLRLSLNSEKPTLGKALKLVIHELRKEKPYTLESSIENQVKTAFSRWRNTSHLEAALRISGQDAGSFEADQKKFQSFLAMAKALEMYMDDVCAQGKLTWNSWRVPEQIKPAFTGEIARLSVEERTLIAAA